MNKLGIDYSSMDGVMNWATAASRDISFATIRATWGTAGVDPRFAEAFTDAGLNQIERIPYHWYVPRHDPIVQARNFVQHSQMGEIERMVDLEDTKTVKAYRGVGAELRRFLEEVKALTGETCLIYVNRDYATRYLYEPWWVEYPLVVASWDSAAPSVPWPWHPLRWFAWQFTYKANGAYYGFATAKVAALYVMREGANA